jgi:hypothetical protein
MPSPSIGIFAAFELPLHAHFVSQAFALALILRLKAA